jgi:hypothetical protein
MNTRDGQYLYTYVDERISNQDPDVPPPMRVEYVESHGQEVIGGGEGTELTRGSSRRILHITTSCIDELLQVCATCLSGRRD